MAKKTRLTPGLTGVPMVAKPRTKPRSYTTLQACNTAQHTDAHDLSVPDCRMDRTLGRVKGPGTNADA
jgi:hypothetical protein